VRTTDYSIASGTGQASRRLILGQIVGADHLLGVRLVHLLGVRLVGFRWRHFRRLLLLLTTMAGHAALPAGFARLFACPLVRRALLVGRFSTLACNVALLAAIHRCKATIFFCHVASSSVPCSNTRAATDVPRKSRKY
jgi:hypothetical protein